MSMKILTEVWHDAPAQGGDLLVLLAIADAADDDHRMSWLSVPTIAKRARLTERSVYRSLENLLTAGLLVNVDEADAPKAAHGYSSAVRMVTVQADWMPVEQTPDNMSPLTSTSPNPSITTAIGSKEQEELRSSVLTPAPSGRKGRRSKSQPELDEDPQSYVLASLEDEGERPRRQKRTLSDPTLPRQKRPKSLPGAANLSRLFGILGKEVGHPVPGITNEAALKGTIQRWMNEGTEYTIVRAMVEAYWSDLFQRSETKPAWQDFIGARGALVALVARENDVASTEADRFSDKW